MSPKAGTCVLLAEMDPKPGGRYRIVIRTPEGEDHDVRGVYREVIPNRRLVFTWAWTGTPERVSLVTVEIRAHDLGSELTLKHEQFFDEAARERHEIAWVRCLAHLERLLEGPR